MAQWNPYYGVPNQTESVYEEQSLGSQNYYGVQALPYGSAPLQPINYNGYYVPNNMYSNFGTNITGTVYNVHELEAQQFARYNQNANPSISGANNITSSAETSASSKHVKQIVKEDTRENASAVSNETTANSTLHANAAEFKPGASVTTNSQISSQTYYRHNAKNEAKNKSDIRNNKGAIRKNYKDSPNESKTLRNDPETLVGDEPGRPESNKPNSDTRSENHRAYNRNNSGQNYTNKPYNRDRNNYNNRNYNRREEYSNTEVESSQRFNNEQSNRRHEHRNDRFENKDAETRNTRYENKNAEYRNNRFDSKESDNRNNRYENRENNYGRNYRRQDYTRENNETNPRSHNYRQNRNNREENSNRNYRDYSERKNTERGSYPRDNSERNNSERGSHPRDNSEISNSERGSFPRDNSERNNSERGSYPRDNSERNNSERGPYPRDNYNKLNSKTSYRNSRYENKGYENWRTGPGSTGAASEHQDKKPENTLNRGKTEKEDIPKSRPFDRKHYRQDKRAEKLPDDDISQRDRLTDQVNKGTLECLVCCDRVRQTDKIWCCQKCYHVFHFRCILKWGNTSKDDNGWRCPACQHVCSEIPSTSLCYCGKVSDPSYNPTDTAHSCGDACGRVGVKPGCVHRCNLLCHPGPCPKCEALISKHCNCGATTQMVKCSAEIVLVCKAICSKILNCGVHKCEKICHGGDCDECPETIYQNCFCGKSEKTIPCSIDQKDIKYYSCEQTCDKVLSCGNHNCKEICHVGDCPACVRAPEQVKTCPCSKSKLEIVRTSCLDPIPCCGKVCGKRYPLCGTPANPHVCKSECHEGDCPSCPLTSFVRCRCGHMNCELTCAELVSRTDDARCEKKCTKKRSCGRHKCNQLCCIDIDHICPLPCNHMLTCGLHRCEQTCHKGRCQPCWRISFDELYCECGTAVIYPPVPCGTRKPPCTKPCTREHHCEHEPLHNCHSQPECPPCTVLTTKLCHGGHEKRSTIPCHQQEFSCGLPCGKELPCGRHKCQLPCHKGSCIKDGQSCTQSCIVVRESCGHNCGLPCHDPPCQESPCKESVKVTCQCGLRSSTRACVDMAGEYQRIATSMLASKMADMQLGHSIDIADIVGTTTRKQTLKTLECNDECRLVERNRRLAIGLQIRNPDLSAKLTPRYSDFMRLWSKKDSAFCQMVHDKLTELVQLSKQSKQKSRSFSFPSMNREKRQFIHEYCEHFGCESAAYDQEPNRNVVATAARDKAWLPSCSLLELIQRESGQRKVPGPILNRPLGVSKTSDTVSLKIPSKSTTASTSASSSTSFSSALQQQQAKTPEDIDYFNFPSGSK